MFKFTDESIRVLAMTLLRNYLINLENFNGQSDNLPDIFEEVRLLALGEAAHGGGDFFRMKTELIKYLIFQKRFRAIIFEGSYGQLVDAYINGGQVEITDALKSLGAWFWHTREIQELVEWLRVYNSQQSPEDRVRFYGCDLQHPQPVAARLMEYLTELGLIDEPLLNGLQWLSETPVKGTYTEEEIAQIQRSKIHLDHVVEQHLTTFFTDPIRAYNHRVLEQWYERQIVRGGDVNIREEFMAENCEFILSHHEKVVWWAHNVHIAKKGEAMQQMVPSGSYLKESLGEHYYVLGFGFFSGSITAHDGTHRITATVEDSEEDLSDTFWARESYSRFLINFKTLPVRFPIIHEPVISRNIGARYYPAGGFRHHTLSESYDGLVFIRHMHPSVIIGD